MRRNRNRDAIVGVAIVGVVMILGLFVLIPKGPRNDGVTTEIILVSEEIVEHGVYERMYEVRAERQQLTPHEFYALVGNFVHEFGIENPTFSVMKDSVGMRHDIQRFWFRYARVEN